MFKPEISAAWCIHKIGNDWPSRQGIKDYNEAKLPEKVISSQQAFEFICLVTARW